MSKIPQATLERIEKVVQAVADGARALQEVESRTLMPMRHVAYGVAAAKTLELLNVATGGDVRLTLLGQALARTKPNSPERVQQVREIIETNNLIRSIAPGLLGPSPPTREEIARNAVQIEPKLSESTALHRASMILKWRDRLMESTERKASRGMWRRLELRNYRSIEHVQIDLAPFTLVVGPNGSGKSNFADALVFIRAIAQDASAALESRGGIIGVRRWRPTKPVDVTVDIRAAASQKGLDTDYVRHRFTIHSGREGNWLFQNELIELVADGEVRSKLERKRNTITGASLSQVSETASMMVLARQLREYQRRIAPILNVRRYRLNPEAMRNPQLSSEKTRLEESGVNIAVAIRSLKDSPDFKQVLASISKIVPGLQDIYVEPVGRFLSLRFRQQVGKEVAEFNATEMSEGALRALGIIVAAVQMTQDELLIMEEPEVSIHVGAANLLYEILKQASQRGAVLVTTHSADLLDAARDEEILVCEYREGITRIGPLAAEQRSIVRDGLFSVAELMRSEPLRIDGEGEDPESA